MKAERQVIFHEDYFTSFYLELDKQSREKVSYVFRLVQTVEKVPVKFLKHVEGTEGLYEIRVKAAAKAIRILCCFDKGNKIVLFNCFFKKSKKAPKHELQLGLRLKQEYFTSKPADNDEEK